ncbi:MAG: AAA family ATPase [Acidimicrobiia bacterium]
MVSVLFCDLVGSTALLEQLGDAGSDELRRDLFAALRRPVEAFGGVEVKSQGDGLMVAFATGPSDAVACAIALQRAAARLAARDEAVPVAIRVGVATGEATGEDGDWYGRPVVEAARLCSAAQPGQVLATATVAALVERELAVRATAVGGLLLKGFAEAVPSVAFDWAEDASGSVSAGTVAVPPMLDPTGLLPFVGRTEASAALHSAWDRAVSGHLAVVTLSGSPGSGKTRLTAEVARTLTREQGNAVLLAGSARADPLADALRWWARASPPDRVRATLGPLVTDVAARIPAIALQLAAGPVPVPKPADRSGTERLDPVVAGLAAVAFTSPVLLLVDDAEALGAASADDLASLVELAPACLLLVLAHREPMAGTPLEAVLSKLDGLPNATAVTLSPWTPAETSAALVAVIPGLDPAGSATLHEVAAGNPARVTELAASARSGRPLAEVVRSAQPFKGLVPYGQGDAEVFFGRDDDVALLLGRLASGRRVLTVTGPSGAGKSSLVRAGLLPALARGALPGSETWPITVVEAARDEPEAIRRAIDELPAAGDAVLVIDQAEELLPTSIGDPRHALIDRLLACVADPDRAVRAVLALRADRYGDLTAHRALAAAVERDHVLVGALGPEQLIGVVNGPAQRSGLRVEPGLAELVVADAAAEPGALPLVSHALRETWRRRRGSLLTIADYREAGGVRGAIASTADELVGSLDANGQRLIRSLFVELAELSDSGEPARRRVPRAAIADLLGTTPAVAEAVLGPTVDARLVVSDGEHVQIAHEALLREWPRLRGWLEEDRERIRFRRTVAAQAAEWDGAGRHPADLLGGGRLELARDDLAAGAEGWGRLARTYVEASLQAHESSREAERAQLITQQRANRRMRALLAGVAVLLVAAVVAGTAAVRERGTAVDEAGRARTEQARADQQAIAADEAAARALAAARTADARRLVGQSAAFTTDPQLELLTAVEAVRREPLPATQARLLGALARSPAVLRHVLVVTSIGDLFPTPRLALLDDDHAALLGGSGLRTWEFSSDGAATEGGPLGDVPTSASLIRTTGGYVLADGSSLTVRRADGTEAGAAALTAPVRLLVGSPGGARAAVLLESGDVVLIDPTDPDRPRVVRSVRPPAPAVLDASSSLAVADDGRLAAMSGATAYQWDAAGVALAPVTTAGTGSGLAFRGDDVVRAVGAEVRNLADLPAADATAESVGVAVSAVPSDASTGPDPSPSDQVVSVPTPATGGSGPLLATSTAPGGGSRVALLDGASIVWSDGGPGRPPSVGGLDPGLGALVSLALTPDGRTAFVGGERGFALVALDGRNALERTRIPLGSATFTSLVPPSVSPDGSRLVLLAGPAASMTSQVVDLATGQETSRVIDGRAGFLDDRTLVAGSIDPEGLRLHEVDAATGAPTGEETLIPGFTPVALVAEDAAGGRLVVSGEDGAVVVERDQTPAWRRLDEVGRIDALALRPGRGEAWVVAAGRLERVDLATTEVEAVPGAGDGLAFLAFSGDGHTLFVSAGPRVLALDMAAGLPTTARLVGVLTADITLLGADATGARVAAVTAAGTLLLDTSTGEALPLGVAALQLDFLPDGDLLVIDGSDARVIALDVEHAVTVACRVAGRVQTPEEWERYGPQDASYAPACAAG